MISTLRCPNLTGVKKVEIAGECRYGLTICLVVAPSGIVSFLFTDIEGSTRRWETDADGMRSALEAHDKLMRDNVEAHGGYLFKHTGDGICAAFASPNAVVDAAVTAQRALELPVRMGIATGEAELRGDDYFGAVLNRAARVMAAGHGGQILLDGTTAGLVSDVELADLGARRLRDISKPVNLFQVLAAGLRSDFPALRTVNSTQGNLRSPATSLHGRTDEIAELQTALKAHRLVTLTGPGGVGKTRLALEVARRVAHEFPDGAFLVELASVTDPVAVPDAVAAVLGITQQAGMDVADSVVSALQERRRLLVFDNCEHLLDATAQMVEAILSGSDSVTVLATSREGLRVAEEVLWPVPSLDTRAGPESAAVQLFVERAGAVIHGTSPALDDPALVDICRRLDGIPLAIELAASRLTSMTVTEVRDRIDDRFRLLVGSRRGLERHQTLRHAVQWSYDLLDDSEKQLLATCSVFAGGFDISGVMALTDSDDEFAALDLLDALVRKSLLATDGSSGRTRYSMLETIRQFAEEQLVASGSAAAVRDVHARYFAVRGGDIVALWDGPHQLESYAWLKTELANMRTAFRWAIDHGDLDTATAVALCGALVGFWGVQHEPIRWAEELIEPAHAVQHRRLAQLYSVATLCFTAGRIDDAVGYAAAGQAALLSGRFDPIRPEGEASIGSPYATIGQVDRWVDWCRIVMAHHTPAHMHTRSTFTLALKMAGLDDEAIAVSEELPAMADTTDNPTFGAYALFAYGMARRDIEPLAAYEALRRGLEVARNGGNRNTECSIATTLVAITSAQGDIAEALDSAVVSIRFYFDSGNFFLVKNALSALVLLFERTGHFEAAAAINGFSDTAFNRSALPELDASVAHLRDALGDITYESLARTGEHMTAAEMVTYALEQIDLARAELADQTQRSPNL
ncbi:adenylate/guanylate cyclase domain-containing protein [Mycolicibacterium moriokaense]|nr:adenylate/guanylate cyclase domain-containing protein [Mycolicibacterium moriokaense]